jgi:arylsulfatase A-like enzyme
MFLPAGEVTFDWRTADGESGSTYLVDWNESVGPRAQDEAGRFPRARLEELVALYDAGIRYVDAELQRLLDGLEALGLAQETIVVVTSDHGEAFLEHGLLAHTEVYEPLLRVPLLLHDPADGGRPRVVRTPVALEDLVPTLLARTRTAVPASVTGRALSSGGEGLPEPRAFYGYSRILREPDYEAYALREGRWKLVHHRLRGEPGFRSELYALDEDPAERHPIDDAARTARMLGRLRSWMAGADEIGREHRLAAEELEALEALGYGGGESR